MKLNPQSRWLPLLEEFVADLRIDSKEAVATDDRGVKLELWDSQSRFLNQIGTGLDVGQRTFNCLKSRQLGVTTISLAIDVFWVAMHSGLIGCLVTDTEANRDANRQVIKRYISSFPEGYFGDGFTITQDNRSFMMFSNGSRLDFLVAGTREKSVSWAEGKGYAFAHLTEVAKYGSPKGLASLEESFAQENPNRLFIYESTANGFNHWRTKWLGAEKDPATKRSFFLGWWSSGVNRILRDDARFLQYGLHSASGEEREKIRAVFELYNHKITPEQLAWIRWKEANIGDDDGIFQQNQPWTADDAWRQTGHSFFQTRVISNDMQVIMDAPAVPVGEGGYGYTAYRYDVDGSFFDIKLVPIEDPNDAAKIELRIWEEPITAGRYVLGMDPAWGRNQHKDRHAISIWRCYADRLVQVAEYATNDVEVKHAAWVLAHLAGAYSDCVVNIELQGPGRALMMEWDHIRGQLNAEMNEALVQARDWENALGNARWYLYNRPDSMGRGYAANFETTWRTKQEIMHQMRGSYVTREMVIRSLKLLQEMQSVVEDGSEIGAPETTSENGKDDRVFAAALAIRAWINWVRPSMLAEGLVYERVRQEESGELPVLSRSLNGMVDRFFKTAQEKAELAPRAPQWMIDRGLV